MLYHYFLGVIFIGFIILPGDFKRTNGNNNKPKTSAVTSPTTASTTTIKTTSASSSTSTTVSASTPTTTSTSTSASISSIFFSSITSPASSTNASKLGYLNSTISSTVSQPNKNVTYKIHGVRVIKRYDTDPYVLRIKTTRFNIIGEHLNNVKEAWLSTLGHCIENDPTRINVQLYEPLFTGEENFVRNASVTLPESEQIYHFCTKTFNDTILAYSFEAWRSFMKLAKEPDTSDVYFPLFIQIPLIVFLAFLSALFSGLNVGLMSLSVSSLELIMKHDEKKKEYAQNILPLRRNGNLLLCTILIGNTFVNNAMTLLLSNLIDKAIDFDFWINFMLSVILPAAIIVFIGEIIPQAICCRHGLIIGSRTRYITTFFIVLTFVVSYPLSKILDWLIGVEGPESYDNATLEHIINMNVEQVGGFTENIAEIARRALQFCNQKGAGDIMTPIDKVFMLPDTAIINKELVKKISENGYTRIPIYQNGDENNIIGILNVKDLVPIDQKFELTIGTVIQIWQRSKNFRYVSEDFRMEKLLKEMKRGQSMALVIRFNNETKNYKIIGIIALEDIIEELTGEILDEKDVKRPKKEKKKLH
uniref:CNNM transmembrane domain-containing protein n=1 Tax=Panagrolaimus sp. PS1159 TaxID=55785 RepID=A0AC35FQK4_9BILA